MICWLRSIFLAGLISLLFVSCQQNTNSGTPSHNTQPNKEQLIEVNKQLTEKDKDIIEAYIKRKRWPMSFYPDGYYGMIIEEGKGPLATNGSTIEMLCTIKLLDGTVCYEDQTRSFVIGKTTEIAGLQRCALRLREGAKARFIFPPHLAYGLVGDRNKIGARSILLFEIEVLKLKP